MKIQFKKYLIQRIEHKTLNKNQQSDGRNNIKYHIRMRPSPLPTASEFFPLFRYRDHAVSFPVHRRLRNFPKIGKFQYFRLNDYFDHRARAHSKDKLLNFHTEK